MPPQPNFRPNPFSPRGAPAAVLHAGQAEWIERRYTGIDAPMLAADAVAFHPGEQP